METFKGIGSEAITFVEVMTGTVDAATAVVVVVVAGGSVVSTLTGFGSGGGGGGGSGVVGATIAVDGVVGLASIGSGSGSLFSISSFTLPESVVTLEGLWNIIQPSHHRDRKNRFGGVGSKMTSKCQL